MTAGLAGQLPKLPAGQAVAWGSCLLASHAQRTMRPSAKFCAVSHKARMRANLNFPPPEDVCIVNSRCAPLAQLVEQLTLNQWVPGSSPGGCTNHQDRRPASLGGGFFRLSPMRSRLIDRCEGLYFMRRVDWSTAARLLWSYQPQPLTLHR